MSETKEEITVERDQLRADVDRLTAENARLKTYSGVPAGPVQHQFVLSEGARQELELHGNAVINGRLMTVDEVRARLGADQAGVEIIAPADPRPFPAGGRPTSAIPGVDFVYPSVAPGQIDPAVAGQPGINGPAADRPQPENLV